MFAKIKCPSSEYNVKIVRITHTYVVCKDLDDPDKNDMYVPKSEIVSVNCGLDMPMTEITTMCGNREKQGE